MKTKNIYQGLALLAMALTTAACQNELNDADTTQPQPGEKVNMTIRATQSMGPQTRTSYEDKLGGTPFDGIVVKWEGGKEAGAPVEKIKVFGYDVNDLSKSVDFSSDPSTLSADGKSITFGGTIDQKAYYLAMYPADKCIYSVEDAVVYTSFLGQTQNCATSMKHLKDFDFMVGSRKDADKNNNFEFTHKATMIRFILSLPSTEIITKVSLASTTDLYSQMWTMADSKGAVVDIDKDIAPVPSFDLAITGHTASATPLNAYMMIPPLNFSGATLTITVNTDGGSIYTGTITAAASQQLEAGKCYTLKPTLTSPTVTVPNVEEGKLQEKLDAITPDPEQDELVLQGAVNATTDVPYLVTFLNNNPNITTLDLSGITIDGSKTVTGFAGATSVTTVVLPNDVEVIGNNAFNGCTALTTVSQNETAPTRGATTRASMPKKVKFVGESAFEGCTSMTEMFLHSGIISIGNYAFKGCTAMTALVFEGTNTVGTGLTLGTNILAGCTHADLKILLPAITDVKVATSYKKALGKSTYFEYNGTYSSATDADKVKSTSYKASVPDGSGLVDIGPGGNWGK